MASSTKIYEDLISEFSQGCNSGVLPQLLPKSQAAFLINATCRGAYVTHRPPYVKLTLTYANPAIRPAVETGFYQGGGWYRPDFGSLQLVAQISGRLFTFTKGISNAIYTVAEISIPGDLNDATASQVWVWQSEKWLIISDGTAKLPIFYDGVSCRRSYGPSVVLGTVTATVPPASFPPAIGDTLEVTMLAAYAGPFDVPVVFNGAYYQTKATPVAAGYPILLTNSFNVIPQTILQGTDLIVHPVPAVTNVSVVSATNLVPFQVFVGVPLVPIALPNAPIGVPAYNTVDTTIPSGHWKIPAGTQITLTLNNAFPVSPSAVTIPMSQIVSYQYASSSIGAGTVTIAYGPYAPPTWSVVSIAPGGLSMLVQLVADYILQEEEIFYSSGLFGYYNHREFYNTQPATITVGGQLASVVTTAPNYSIGKTIALYTSPANGVTITIYLDLLYAGPANQEVFIGTSKFTVASPPPPAPSTTLYLLNLSDTSVLAIPIPPDMDILSVPELPAGRMGAYGLGQNWMSLTDGISFIAGDIVGSAAGTQASNYRDAVLKTTGQTFLFGGSFRLPGSGTVITSMTFTANLDVSLGQGALQVGSDSGIFSCLAPFDFTNPPQNNIPILTESLIGFGPLAQNSTVLANSDTLFRQFTGLGSLILARRYFSDAEWGNTPISREMTRTFSKDNQSLLSFGSAVVYDNRLLDTCSPQVSAQGVFHAGVVALNFDLISSLRGKAPPVYDGLWTGLNALQIINIQSGSEARAFIFGFNLTDSKIELYELLKSEDAVYFDNGTIPIKWVIETPILFNKDIKPMSELIRLTNGEIWVQDIVGAVNIKVQYRPDFYSGSANPGCWVDWTQFDVCATATGENIRAGYRTRLGLGEPSGVPCEEGNNRPLRVGHFFQFKIEITGHCKFMALRVQAVVQPIADYAPPICPATNPLCISNPPLPELEIP